MDYVFMTLNGYLQAIKRYIHDLTRTLHCEYTNDEGCSNSSCTTPFKLHAVVNLHDGLIRNAHPAVQSSRPSLDTHQLIETTGLLRWVAVRALFRHDWPPPILTATGLKLAMDTIFAFPISIHTPFYIRQLNCTYVLGYSRSCTYR